MPTFFSLIHIMTKSAKPNGLFLHFFNIGTITQFVVLEISYPRHTINAVFTKNRVIYDEEKRQQLSYISSIINKREPRNFDSKVLLRKMCVSLDCVHIIKIFPGNAQHFSITQSSAVPNEYGTFLLHPAHVS